MNKSAVRDKTAAAAKELHASLSRALTFYTALNYALFAGRHENSGLRGLRSLCSALRRRNGIFKVALSYTHANFASRRVYSCVVLPTATTTTVCMYNTAVSERETNVNRGNFVLVYIYVHIVRRGTDGKLRVQLCAFKFRQLRKCSVLHRATAASRDFHYKQLSVEAFTGRLKLQIFIHGNPYIYTPSSPIKLKHCLRIVYFTRTSSSTYGSSNRVEKKKKTEFTPAGRRRRKFVGSGSGAAVAFEIWIAILAKLA